MSRLSHRPTCESDLPRVCHFFQTEDELYYTLPKASFPLTTQALSRAVEKSVASTVVCLDGEPAGYANLYRDETQGTCFVGQVAVAPEFRHRGVGQYLISTILAQTMVRFRHRELWLSCFADNTPALLLYGKLGFQPVSMQAVKHPKWGRMALLYLRLSLSVRASAPKPPAGSCPQGLAPA